MEVNNNIKISPVFTAIPVANTVNRLGKLETKIDLWELSIKDKKFLQELQERVDMKTLMPNVSDGHATRWHEMLEIAASDVLCGDDIFLAVSENKPCGIMSVSNSKQHYKVSAVCTWPVEVGKKVKFAGKTLFYHLFKTFMQKKGKDITLRAIQDGPYKTVPKYQDLGFVVTSKNRLVNMELKGNKVKSNTNKLARMIEYTPIKNGKEQNLLNILDI